MDSGTILFADDFTRYAPGFIPNSYSPWGEYHCRTDQGRLGPWREATTHYSWLGANGGCWRIVDDGIIDGTVNGMGNAARAVGWLGGQLQTGRLGTYVLFFVLGAVVILLRVAF